MNDRSLGNSGLNVTPIGLGLAALGRPGYINLGHGDDLESDYQLDSMEARAHRVLDAAWETGIRYFDAARSYGRAEAFLSSWLQTRQHPDLTISSKWGYTYTADWQIEAEAHEVKEHSLKVLNEQIKQSREQLGEQLHLYQIHSATLESGVLDNQPVLERLGELKSEGLRIGLSVSGAGQSDVIQKALSTRINGSPLFDTCQATWNLLETSATAALSEAHQSGMGIIIKEGLANGRLTCRNTTESFRRKREVLETLAKRCDTTIDALSLAAVLAQPWVDTVLSGAATPEHLQSNQLAVSLQMPDDVLSTLSSLTEAPETYWKTRSELAWN